MLIHGLLNKDSDIFTEEAPLIVLDSKSTICMDKNGNYTKHTRKITRRMYLVRNRESARCTRLIGVKEVCNRKKLLPRMLVRLI